MGGFCKDFFAGFECAVQGIKIFFRDRTLWKYAAFPMLIVLLCYALIACAAVVFTDWAMNVMADKLAALPGFLQWLIQMFCGVGWLVMAGLLLVLAVYSITTLYEIFGGLFFDAMVEKYEAKYNGFQAPAKGVGFNLLFMWESMIYSVNTLIIMIIASLVAALIPVVGHIFMVWVMGVRFASAYGAVAGFNRSFTFRKTVALMKKFPAECAGFGISAYLLTLIPGGILIFLPGLVIGGVLLFQRIKGS